VILGSLQAASSGLKDADSGLLTLLGGATVLLLFGERPKLPQRRWLLAISVIGLALSLSYFLAMRLALFVAAAVATFVVVIVGAALTATDNHVEPSAGQRPFRRRVSSLRRWLIAVALGVVGIVIGHWVLSPGTSHKSISHKRTPTLPTYKPFYSHVYGTCAAGHCGLNEHSAPTNDRRTLVRGHRRDDESPVTILCQKHGATVIDPPDQQSSVWDMLDDRHYVSDLFVRTPGSRAGRYSRRIERCRA
jgi:hypothetical protein